MQHGMMQPLLPVSASCAWDKPQNFLNFPFSKTSILHPLSAWCPRAGTVWGSCSSSAAPNLGLGCRQGWRRHPAQDLLGSLLLSTHQPLCPRVSQHTEVAPLRIHPLQIFLPPCIALASSPGTQNGAGLGCPLLECCSLGVHDPFDCSKLSCPENTRLERNHKTIQRCFPSLRVAKSDL